MFCFPCLANSEKYLRPVIVGLITLNYRNGQAGPMSETILQMTGSVSQLELAGLNDINRTTAYKYIGLLEA